MPPRPGRAGDMRRTALPLVGTLLLVFLPASLAAQGPAPLVIRTAVDDAIHPITSEFITGALEIAEGRGAEVFVLQLSTPGGLETAMREIMSAFLNSPVPIVLYVGPSGAHAASAGFLIAMAADVVAMAPGTNMGAASPVAVGVGGGDVGETMERKMMQDATAYARSVAERQGRPADLAAEAVTSGRSFPAEEAVELGLADFLADDVDEVITRLDGMTIGDGDGGTVLELSGAVVEDVEMTLRQRFLATLANPQVAYILLLLGALGLYFEFSTPGAILPGVLGGISLLLALLAFQILPISFAGLALIALAILFFIAEVKVASYGLLTVAGLVSFVLGSLILIPGPVPELRLHLGFVLPTALAVAAVAAGLLWLVIRTHRGRVMTGAKGLVGEVGEARDEIDGTGGRVFVHGELWKARAEEPVAAGQEVEVVGIGDGMVLRVRPRTTTKGNPR